VLQFILRNTMEWSTKQPSVEQRKHRRHSVRFDSIFSPNRVQIDEGLVVDLSLGGCRIKSTRQFPPETPIELQIRPERDTSIYVSKAVVRWVAEGALEWPSSSYSTRKRPYSTVCCGHCLRRPVSCSCTGVNVSHVQR
jgi:hypothetical protein